MVSPDFLSRVTSAVSVEIYAVGIFRDKLVGTVRILISSLHPTASSAPAFAAFLIHSPSGEFFGSLNVGAMVVNGLTGFRTLIKASTVDYHDLGGGDNLAGKQLIIRSTNISKATVRDIPGSIPSDSSVHRSEPSESIISPSLKALKLEKKKKLAINLGKATIWKYTMKLLR
ncbi:uncharacterized protein LOC120203977 [Hibiscus syriacus]|uniref:uncharacterized protein LOC120203977 n=1 Tax=Hibiscus syriacus TaxID=106335 RepID=UPI001924FE2C|nr:uncharacterized protein LOC120203977 [Hibiscus syriacus]